LHITSRYMALEICHQLRALLPGFYYHAKPCCSDACYSQNTGSSSKPEKKHRVDST